MTETSHPTTEAPDASTRFLHELSDMQVDSSHRNRTLTRLGIVLLVAGVAVTWIGFLLSQTTDNPLDQSSALSFGLAGIATAVIGLGVYLRYSFGQFLRFWLVRLSYERQQGNT